MRRVLKINKYLVLLIVLVQLAIFLNSRSIFASVQPDSDLSLDAILNLPVTVASKKATTIREAPGIVTVITDEDILKMGARDMIDIFQMVPGFSMGFDVQGVVDLGIRGNWAHEGKSLLIIDGHEMNELNFATNNFGNHYPVDQIKKIEIIRGPGSAIYGGFSELAVIKITTKSSQDLKGISANLKGGLMDSSGTLGRADMSIQGGEEIGDLSFKVGGFFGRGNRSDRLFTDMYGNSVQMAKESSLNPSLINVDLKYREMDISFLWDHYGTTYADGYSVAFPNSIVMNFDSYHGNAKYDFKFLEGKLLLTPQFKFEQYRGWNSTGTDAERIQNFQDSAGNSIYGAQGINYGRITNRTRLSLVSSYDVVDNVNLLVGLEKNFFASTDTVFTFNSGSKSVGYNSFAVFGQGVWNSPIVNVTLGARFESHNVYGGAFVPRIALTKVIDSLHFKLLASQAFRAPSIDNIDANASITPERTTVYELESGYQFSREVFLTANIFDITINNPIVYSANQLPGCVSSNNCYVNYPQTGSRGLELEFKYVGRNYSSTVAYSYYNTANKNLVPAYAVPGLTDQVLGLAPHKITWNNAIHITNNLLFSPQLVLLGSRYGYDYGGNSSNVFSNFNTASQSSQLMHYSPTWLVNSYFRYKDLFIENLSVGFGVYNILNQNYRFIQAYYNTGAAHPPLPAGSRELVLDVSYKIVI